MDIALLLGGVVSHPTLLGSQLLACLLIASCAESPTSVPTEAPPLQEAAPVVELEQIAPGDPVAPSCPGEPLSFRFLYWTGHVGPGHVERYTVNGELGDEGLVLQYDWAGDIGGRGDVARGELHWAGMVTGEEAAAWRGLLDDPVVAKPDPETTRGKTGGRTKDLHVTYGGDCELYGGARDARGWETRARELYVLAGADLPREQKVAYGLANDDVRVSFTGLVEPSTIEVLCPSGFRTRARVDGHHRATARDVPQEDCTLSFRDPGSSFEGAVRGGTSLVCKLESGEPVCTER